YSYVSLYFKTNTEDSAMQIEENDKVFLKMKEIQFISTSGEKIQVETYINDINLLRGRNGNAVLIKKASIPQGTYSKAIIVLEEPNGFVNHENNLLNMDLFSSNEIVIDFSHPVELVNGLTTEINVDFHIESIKKESGDAFSIELSSAKYINSSIDLPFQPGVLLVSLTSRATITKDKDGLSKTGLDSLDEILFKHKCVFIKRIIDDFPDLDMDVAEEVGLDRTYIFLFEYSHDVIETMIELKNNQDVESITVDAKLEVASEKIPTDTLAQKLPSWKEQALQLDNINAYKGWGWFTDNSREIGDPNLKIAVVDSGIDDSHEDMDAAKIIQASSFHYGRLDYCQVTLPVYQSSPMRYPCMEIGTNSKPYDSNDPKLKLRHYHGTRVASIIGAKTDNGQGIAGINWKSKIISINVFNNVHPIDPSIYSIGLGIFEAVKKGAKVINISLGSNNGSPGCGRELPKPNPSTTPYRPWIQCVIYDYINFGFEHKIVQYAYKKGVVIVAAAGNDGKKLGDLGNGLIFGDYPGSFPEVISVSAVAVDITGDKRWKYSNYGQVDISAPGEVIYTAMPGNAYDHDDGTSFAAPMVSGLASLILSIQPDMHPKLVLETMCKAATKLATEEQVGCGKIDMEKVFTDSTTDPSQSFPKISVHPNYTDTCEIGLPTICYKTRHSFLYGETGRENTISFYDQPLIVEGGQPPYTWSVHNLVNKDGIAIHSIFDLSCIVPIHTYSPFMTSVTFLGNEKKVIEYLDKLINPEPSLNQPKKSSVLPLTTMGDSEFIFGPTFSCFQDELYWMVDIKVTDSLGRSDMKRFEFFKDYTQYMIYKQELERQNSPLSWMPLPLFPPW
ncbi:MAG: S8 family serine peptidase, partial [Leptospiraceae bacterium]|nr:S8 family serine peptidase [Leptospiraceae bacterium]